MHEAQDQRSLERQPTAVKEGLLNREAGTRDVIFLQRFWCCGVWCNMCARVSFHLFFR